MKSEQQNVSEILVRIERLERENRRLKSVCLAVLLIGSVTLLMGQAKAPPPKGWTPVDEKKSRATIKRPTWVMPDGRVVAFSASTSEREIDELSSRIAFGATDLLPGAEVVGWESRQDMKALLPEYAERIATIPTTKGKLDALANGASILQGQITELQWQSKARQEAAIADENTANENTKIYNAAIAALDFRVGRLEFDSSSKREADDIKRALDDFKDAVCPFLRGANVSWSTKMKVDSACGVR
jgi:hypothetical protein